MKINDINYAQARALKGLIIREQDKVNDYIHFIINNHVFNNDRKEFELKKQVEYYKKLDELYDMFSEIVIHIEEDSYGDEVIEDKTLKDVE